MSRASPDQLPRVGLIGFGAISRLLLGELNRADAKATLAAVLVRPNRLAEVRAGLPSSISVITQVQDLASFDLDLVAECAGQQALLQYGEAIVRLGLDLVVIATGALVDDSFREALTEAACQSGARILIPAGAIAGIDGLNALRLGGLFHVRYTSTKPPDAWLGTPAEERFDLGHLTHSIVIFRGSARDAAWLFPKNANLAATVALAGVGFDKTEIVLIADPGLQGNLGKIEAEGRYGRLLVELQGPATPENAKTSAVTAFSILHAIENRNRTIAI